MQLLLGLFPPRETRSEDEAAQPPQSIAEVKNKWSDRLNSPYMISLHYRGNYILPAVLTPYLLKTQYYTPKTSWSSECPSSKFLKEYSVFIFVYPAILHVQPVESVLLSLT
jgi:hypothetical protein